MSGVLKSEIPDLLAAADFGVHVLADVELFRTSVSPNKVFDYMAAGLYVLTNCTGIVGDLVTTCGAGMVVDPRQLELGLKAVSATDSAERTECGDRGRQWIEQEQSRTAMALTTAFVPRLSPNGEAKYDANLLAKRDFHP